MNESVATGDGSSCCSVGSSSGCASGGREVEIDVVGDSASQDEPTATDLSTGASQSSSQSRPNPFSIESLLGRHDAPQPRLL